MKLYVCSSILISPTLPARVNNFLLSISLLKILKRTMYHFNNHMYDDIFFNIDDHYKNEKIIQAIFILQKVFNSETQNWILGAYFVIYIVSTERLKFHSTTTTSIFSHLHHGFHVESGVNCCVCKKSSKHANSTVNHRLDSDAMKKRKNSSYTLNSLKKVLITTYLEETEAECEAEFYHLY